MPYISVIMDTPRPRGCEFKALADIQSGCILKLKIQRGAAAMARKEYQADRLIHKL